MLIFHYFSISKCGKHKCFCSFFASFQSANKHIPIICMSKVQNNKSSVRYHIVAKKNIKNPDIIYSSRTVKIAHNFEKGTNRVFVTIQTKKNNGYLWQYYNLQCGQIPSKFAIIFHQLSFTCFQDRASATGNLIQARSIIILQIFLTGCFLYERIETQNLGKEQTLSAFLAVAALFQS